MAKFDKWAEAHRNWRIRLRAYVSGISTEKLDASIVEKDNVCDLGKWIYEERQVMAGNAAFGDLVKLHAQFHKAAAAVIRAYADGKKAEAAKLIDVGSEFLQLSNKVGSAIERVASATNK